MSAGPRTEFDFVEAFWQSLVQLDERVVARAARRRMLRTLAIAVLALLAAAAIALAASGVLFGSAAPPRLAPHQPLLGLPKSGSTPLLGLQVPDTDGGPRWDARLFTTSKERACVQVGRVVDGRLVALGVAGAFGDDGRAHPLPLEGEACGKRRGETVSFAAESQVTDRSGLLGGACVTSAANEALRVAVPGLRRYLAHAIAAHDVTAIARTRRALHEARDRLARAAPLCRPADERTIAVGTVSSRVRRIVAVAGRQHVAESPRQGFYLVVLVGAAQRLHPTLIAEQRGGARCLLHTGFGPNRVRSPGLQPCDRATEIRSPRD